MHINCKDFTLQGVKISLFSELGPLQSQFPTVNDALLALGRQHIAELQVKTPLSVRTALLLRRRNLMRSSIGRPHSGSLMGLGSTAEYATAAAKSLPPHIGEIR